MNAEKNCNQCICQTQQTGRQSGAMSAKSFDSIARVFIAGRQWFAKFI